LDCSRRLGLAMNTVKRYARAATPERIQRVPKYRACMVDPYRDHLRARREQEPGVGATALLGEIRALGYTGSQNLLVRYLNQGRHLDDHPHLSPRRAARLLLTRPENLTERQRERVEALAAACPEMAALATAARSFATLLAPRKNNPPRLATWTTATHEVDLPHVHSFARGINQDIDAVTAAITLAHHNGRTEGVNTKTKLLKRQMYGRAGLALLRHRILLG
jgi:transposase